MLHLIPPPLHRLAYRVAHQLRKIWLRVTRAELHGSCVIGRDRDGRVLLVRHSYGVDVWAFPGGGMKKGEDPQIAALRELDEELGCSISNPRHLGTRQELYQGTTNYAYIFTGRIEGEPRPDMREIVEARFFHLSQLPDNIAKNVEPRLAMLNAR